MGNRVRPTRREKKKRIILSTYFDHVSKRYEFKAKIKRENDNGNDVSIFGETKLSRMALRK